MIACGRNTTTAALAAAVLMLLPLPLLPLLLLMLCSLQIWWNLLSIACVCHGAALTLAILGSSPPHVGTCASHPAWLCRPHCTVFPLLALAVSLQRTSHRMMLSAVLHWVVIICFGVPLVILIIFVVGTAFFRASGDQVASNRR
jgi:hypothetical protein